MAEETGISWCDHTFNPIIGCTKISPACDHCYAETWANRFYKDLWNGKRHVTSAAYWRQPLKWNRDAKAAGVRRRVFCASLSDVFDNQWPPEVRAALWKLIAECDSLDWMLLTKRPQNIAKMLPISPDYAKPWRDKWPWSWVWFGTTAEDQERYDQRMPHLAAINCARRFVSYEPALGPVDFLSGHSPGDDEPWAAKLDLVICGGESGPHARPIHPGWARSARDQCRTAGIYFHFKQWGGWRPATADDTDYNTNPNDRAAIGLHLDMIRVGKTAAGRLLDGRTHDEMPA